jgi:hypothetical protein
VPLLGIALAGVLAAVVTRAFRPGHL